MSGEWTTIDALDEAPEWDEEAAAHVRAGRTLRLELPTGSGSIAYRTDVYLSMEQLIDLRVEIDRFLLSRLMS